MANQQTITLRRLNTVATSAENYAERNGSCAAGLKAARLDRGQLPRKSKAAIALYLDREIARLEVMARGEREAEYVATAAAREKGEKRRDLAARLIESVAADPTADAELRDVARVVLPLFKGQGIMWGEFLKALNANGHGPAELLEFAVSLADDEARAATAKQDWLGMNTYNADAHTIDTARKALNYK